MTMKRRAFVHNTDPQCVVDRVATYLPDNYRAMAVENGVLIFGKDKAGWTLDGYVIPRLASGLIFAEEVDVPQDASEHTATLYQELQTDSVRQLLEYGPAYDRTFRTFVDDATYMADNGRDREAEYWARLALLRLEALRDKKETS